MSTAIEFSAAIFDLDGTLLYTLEEIAAATNTVLARAGYPQHPVDAYRRFVGDGARTLAFRALPKEKQNDTDCDSFFPALLEEYDRSLNTIAHPYAGVTKALQGFYDAGKQIAVLSNKPDVLTKNAIKKFFPTISFDIVQGGRPDFPLKPAPDAALDIAARLNVSPQQVIFVGDSDVDIKTACNAGMIPVGAGWGFRGAEELLAVGATVVLDVPSDLESLT
ncbi:MAG: HAD family hydrolase [Desulfovibrionales bacterium]|nr:HAD family hydrolase [Desulfovibrionales bacterium]